MEAMLQRHSNQSTPLQTATPELTCYTDLLIDGDYVAKLRAGYRMNFEGLVIGDPKAFDVSLGFKSGEWIVSKAAQAALTPNEVWVAMQSHGCGNWGDVGQDTMEANFCALQHAGELRSAYHTMGGVCFSIITNAERTRTTIELDRELSP